MDRGPARCAAIAAATELVRDLVSLIQRAEADEACQVVVFNSADPDYFISHVDVTRIDPEAQRRTGVAMTRGFQTRAGEMTLSKMVGELADR